MPVTLEYRLPDGDWQTVTAGNPLPVYVNVGEYPLTVRASNPNYDNQPTASATLSITPREVTVRAGSGSFLYDGLTHTVTGWTVDATGATTGLIGTDTITGAQLTGNARAELGSNAITVAVTAWSAGADPANYHGCAVRLRCPHAQGCAGQCYLRSNLRVLPDPACGGG